MASYGLIGFQCIVGQWSLDLQTFRPAATIPIRFNSIRRGSTVLDFISCIYSFNVSCPMLERKEGGREGRKEEKQASKQASGFVTPVLIGGRGRTLKGPPCGMREHLGVP